MNVKSKCKLKMEKIKGKVNFMITVLFIFCSRMQVYADKGEESAASAGKFAESKLITGTKLLLKDFAGMLLILAPLLGGAVGVYCWIRKGAADEQDQKKWDNRIMVDIIAIIGAMVFSSILTTITTYYKA